MPEYEITVETDITTPKYRPNIRRVGKFGVVGVANTLIDFGIYNVLSGLLGLPLIQANLISTTVAMSFSFISNKKLVFKKHDGSIARQAAVFFIVTAFGLYILQTGTIALLTDVWLWPIETGIQIAHWLGITGHDDFLIRNGAKAIATTLSLSWNYVMYKKVVFK